MKKKKLSSSFDRIISQYNSEIKELEEVPSLFHGLSENKDNNSQDDDNRSHVTHDTVYSRDMRRNDNVNGDSASSVGRQLDSNYRAS